MSLYQPENLRELGEWLEGLSGDLRRRLDLYLAHGELVRAARYLKTAAPEEMVALSERDIEQYLKSLKRSPQATEHRWRPTNRAKLLRELLDLGELSGVSGKVEEKVQKFLSDTLSGAVKLQGELREVQEDLRGSDVEFTGEIARKLTHRVSWLGDLTATIQHWQESEQRQFAESLRMDESRKSDPQTHEDLTKWYEDGPLAPMEKSEIEYYSFHGKYRKAVSLLRRHAPLGALEAFQDKDLQEWFQINDPVSNWDGEIDWEDPDNFQLREREL
jgi:hypothetical protein